jgi:hypothetical protein
LGTEKCFQGETCANRQEGSQTLKAELPKGGAKPFGRFRKKRKKGLFHPKMLKGERSLSEVL